MSDDPNQTQKAVTPRKLGATLGWIMAWAWAIVAGGGGLLLLLEKGPLPLTNGWFALLSGIAACPLTAWVFKRLTGVTVSGWLRFSAAAVVFIAGRIALAAGI
jgi:hypothetical protein